MMETAVKLCILTGDLITPETDSKAHIIPMALGGRLKPTGILTRRANNVLDEKFDKELVKAYQEFMVLIDAKREKGSSPPIKALTKSGRKIQFDQDGIKLTDLSFEKEELADGECQYKLGAPSEKVMRQLLGRVQKDYPSADIEQLLKACRKVQEEVGKVNFDLQFGPRSTFPAVFAAASIYARLNGLDIHPQFVSYTNSFDVEARPMPPDTFYFSPSRPWFSLESELRHCLILVACPKRKQALFYYEIFSQPGIAVILPYGGEKEQIFTYGYDLIQGVQRTVRVKSSKIRREQWKETHRLGENRLNKLFENKSAPILRRFQQLQFEVGRDAVMLKHWPTGTILTEKGVNDMSRELAELFMKTYYPEGIPEKIARRILRQGA